MQDISNPNLPKGKVTYVVIDGRADNDILKSLSALNINAILTQRHPDVYEAISYHPDIMLHHIGFNRIVVAPNTPQPLIDSLENLGMKIIAGATKLKEKYPATIPYNVARVGKFAFHSTKYTDPVLRRLLEEEGVLLIDIKQGYTKCLTCIVDERSIISSDAGICNAAKEVGIDTLLIEQDEAISLKPFNMGFFGGATGLVSPNTLAVTGNIKNMKSFAIIEDFLKMRGKKLAFLSNKGAIDLGSILPIKIDF